MKRPVSDEGFGLKPETVKGMLTGEGCPFCHSQLFKGPHGGMCVNVFCGNPNCNSRFNISDGSFGVLWGQFTGKCPEDFIEQRNKELYKNDFKKST